MRDLIVKILGRQEIGGEAICWLNRRRYKERASVPQSGKFLTPYRQQCQREIQAG